MIPIFLLKTKNYILKVSAATILILFTSQASIAQSHIIKGIVQDSTGLPLPGALVKIISPQDSLAAGTDLNGAFTINNVKNAEFTLSAAFLGFQTFIKKYKAEGQTLIIPPIKLKVSTNTLNEVVVTAVTAVKISEDTVAYNAASFPVREGDAVEEVLKKLPGVTVDKDGNVTSQGQAITKVRVNGKDFFGTDVATAIQNLPADIIKNLQFIDDYGDQAKLTGVKTGDPEKVLNINIQEDKKRGYFARAGAGMGTVDRYSTYLRANTFKGERQISFDGTVNNANMRGVTSDGITNTSSAGVNYRNEWNKKLSADGGYSFSKRDNNTLASAFTQNFLQDFTRLENSTSNNSSLTSSHNFSGNLEYKMDTLNYFKISPNLSYNSADRVYQGLFDISQPDINTIRDNHSLNNSASFNTGSSLFYNHKFHKRGRNITFNGNVTYSRGESDNSTQNDYKITKAGADSVRYQNQFTDNKNDILRSWMYLSYMEPLAKRSFIQVIYFTSRSETRSSRDTRDIENGISVPNPNLSNEYEYQFTTNRIGVNYRYQHEKYNYTLGFNAQPALLEGQNISKNINTKNRTLNWIPSARFIYRFTKQKAFTMNYNGRNNQPSFSQLQPLTDNSNLQNLVTGNPDLNPEFTHSLNLGYNQSDWNMGHTLFANLSYSNTQNKIVTTKTLIPNTNNQLTSYTNTDGFYNLNGNYSYSIPFSDRKYTLTWRGNGSLNNNVAFIDNNRNVAENFVVRQELEFEIDIKDIIDLELETSYAINKTRYSQQSFEDRRTNRLQFEIEGRTYFFKDLTLGYDFTKTINSGFDNSSIKNPAILHLYTQYRFLKGDMASIRLQAFDLLNQNTGISRDVFDNIIVDRQVNRLGRYFMISLNLRLNKFSGSGS
ncbi:MAG TPA: outer membrane beta-barrel protein [Sphingobacteriaceae bacterium]